MTVVPFDSATIVIPVLNGQDTIESTVRSALAQDFPGPVKVIVVDNGSTDQTCALVERHPVTLLAEPLRGRSRARNRGAAEAKTELLGFADADCALPSTWLRDAAALLSKAWVGGVQARIQKHDGAPPPRDFIHARYFSPFLDTCALVTKRSAFTHALGFDVELGRNEDMEFSFRLLGAGYALGALPDTIAIKHHDLDQHQALRRGWHDGLNLALVDAKWRERMPSPRARRLGALKGWVRGGLLGTRRSSRPRQHVAEKTAAAAGYLLAQLRQPALPPVWPGATATQLPAALGSGKSLFYLGPDEAVVFDAAARTQSRLGASELRALEATQVSHESGC